MKVNVKISIAVIALVASTFGLASKSFAQTSLENSSINTDFQLDNADKSNPAAAAAVFSTDAQGNITQGAVSASVGSKSAGAAAVSGTLLNEDGDAVTNVNAAAALGSDKTSGLKVNPESGTIDFTTTTELGE
ncbi:hypothetical protein DSM106972_032970 [Dulcicalothrix desertica PCC 7102]|uniref:Uncharacterized protein n=1 Tax=Dulcicalothrix desertica PCC 7102 TaxID=232991 RepID=A0A433VJ03_9CYAN|nr:hypothetical protein [Dulcicalothrix desertica]RUT06091.1 hypothetical protein DSM106972_032970 [Dulcicalothrix desertica PCC 7102]TWH54248.1 hypothetical protein CAL7102_02262 [Dulcicalothrix desertica PCC 7102]